MAKSQEGEGRQRRKTQRAVRKALRQKDPQQAKTKSTRKSHRMAVIRIQQIKAKIPPPEKYTVTDGNVNMQNGEDEPPRVISAEEAEEIKKYQKLAMECRRQEKDMIPCVYKRFKTIITKDYPHHLEAFLEIDENKMCDSCQYLFVDIYSFTQLVYRSQEQRVEIYQKVLDTFNSRGGPRGQANFNPQLCEKMKAKMDKAKEIINIFIQQPWNVDLIITKLRAMYSDHMYRIYGQTYEEKARPRLLASSRLRGTRMLKRQ